MNEERPNEHDAKSIVETELGVEFAHADHTGGVDYLSKDGRHALEVTRVTDGSKLAGRKALGRSRPEVALPGELQTCWTVFLPEGHAKLRSLVQRIHPAVVELERAGEALYRRQAAAIHIWQGGPLSASYRVLLDAGVDRASAVPHSDQHRHKVIVSLMSGGSSSGSDQAILQLGQVLEARTDTAAKLRASGRERRHLFVWLDDDTQPGGAAVERWRVRPADNLAHGGSGGD